VVVARAPEQVRKSLLVAAPLSEVVKRPDAPIRYEKINEDRRKSLAGQGKELAKYRDQRAQWESKGRQTSEVKPAQAAPRTPKEPSTSLKALSKKPGEVQPDRPSKEPVQLQPDKASKRQGEIPTAQPPGKKKTFEVPQATEPQKQKIPKSPVVGKHVATPGQGGNPPGRPEVPKPDPSIRSKPADKDDSKREAPAPRAPAPSGGKGQGKKGKSGK
jgi:hypothetical protein